MFTHKGFNISVNQSGRFLTRVGEIDLHEASLEDLKKSIDREIASSRNLPKLALKVLAVVEKERAWNDRRSVITPALESLTITGINRTTSDLISTVPKGFSSEHYVPDTPGCRRILETFREAQQAFEKAKEELGRVELIKNGYGRIDAASYSGKVNDLKKFYGEAVQYGEKAGK